MNKERLLRLADHLERGVLMHSMFDFSSLNSNERNGGLDAKMPTREHPCGTNGCAIGECPAAFPEDWFFDPQFSFYPTLIDSKEIDTSVGHKSFTSAAKYFDISNEEVDVLFMPSSFMSQAQRDSVEESGSESFEKEYNDDYVNINGNAIWRQFHSASKEQIAIHIHNCVSLKERVSA